MRFPLNETKVDEKKGFLSLKKMMTIKLFCRANKMQTWYEVNLEVKLGQLLAFEDIVGSSFS